MSQKLTRVAVFYDGAYFSKVSDYYRFYHARQARLSMTGVHDFIRKRLAEEEAQDLNKVSISDVHYFRGRASLRQLQGSGDMEQNPVLDKRLRNERIFEDVLVREGVTQHYMPLANHDGVVVEKGIDVWLALEAFELASRGRYDVLALIAGDSDYLPLIRKLTALGIRTLLLGWNVHMDQEGYVPPRTSMELLGHVTYPQEMEKLVGTSQTALSPDVEQIFVSHYDRRTHAPLAEAS